MLSHQPLSRAERALLAAWVGYLVVVVCVMLAFIIRAGLKTL